MDESGSKPRRRKPYVPYWLSTWALWATMATGLLWAIMFGFGIRTSWSPALLVVFLLSISMLGIVTALDARNRGRSWLQSLWDALKTMFDFMP